MYNTVKLATAKLPMSPYTEGIILANCVIISKEIVVILMKMNENA